MKTCLCILTLTAASVVGACGYRTWQLLGDARAAVVEARTGAHAVAVRVDARSQEALALIREAVIKADMQVTGARGDVRRISSLFDAPIAELTYAIREFKTDARPVLAEAQRTLANVTLTTHDLRPQLLGLVAGWKVVGGETAQTMRDIQRATPEAIHSFQAIQGSVRDTSQSIALGFPRIVQNTGGIAENINRITKPRWWETPLKAAVAGAVVAGSLK